MWGVGVGLGVCVHHTDWILSAALEKKIKEKEKRAAAAVAHNYDGRRRGGARLQKQRGSLKCA